MRVYYNISRLSNLRSTRELLIFLKVYRRDEKKSAYN